MNTLTSSKPLLKRKPLWAAMVAFVAAVGFVLVWFEPQKLFIDERVNESFPTAAAPATQPPGPSGAAGSVAPDSSVPAVPPASAAPATTSPAAPMVLARGSFASIEHDTSGTVALIAQPDGSHVLRFEDLTTSNGPDLRVLLSPSLSPDENYEAGSIDLGSLKGNQGNQNYEVPPGSDVAQFRSAVIWCQRFSVAFGIADLRPL